MTTMIDNLTPTAAEQTFNDVTIYFRSSFGSILRVDARALSVTTGVKYAQYTNATKVTWLAKGKRKPQGMYLTYAPFFIVVRREDAINPESMLGEARQTATGMTVRESRYACFDDRWVSDFRAALAAKNVQPLVSIVAEDRNW